MKPGPKVRYCGGCHERLPPKRGRRLPRRTCDACQKRRVHDYNVRHWAAKRPPHRACSDCGKTCERLRARRCDDCGRAQRKLYAAAYWQYERPNDGLCAAVHSTLGGKCVRCGFSDSRALQLDHINGGGLRDKRSTATRYRQILSGKSVGEFQLLCANCNWIKRAENGEEWGYLSQ